MAELFDVYGQWFFLNIVYQHELLVLPLVAGLLLLGKRNVLWSLIRGVLLIGTLFYLLLFRMHWYSLFAWPLMVAAWGFDWSRLKWYRILAFRSHAGLSPSGKNRHVLTRLATTFLSKLRVQNLRHDWRTLSIVIAVVVGVPSAIFFLSIPSDLFVILAVVTVAAALLAWRFAVRAGDERRFNRYLDRDPRMVRYLNWVRWLRADRDMLSGSLLARSRLPLDE